MKKKQQKRRLVILLRMFNTGLHNLVRNFWLSTAATAVVAISLSILLTTWIANTALNETVDERTRDFSVGLYFVDATDPGLISDLRADIEAKEYVEEVNYISKEEALQIFLQRGSDEGDDSIAQGIEVVGENPTPASFDIRFNDLTMVDEVLAIAEEEEYQTAILDTSDNSITRTSINNYVRFQDWLQTASLFGVLIFASIAALIVFNTIRMAVFSRSDEIEIMKLIGATPGYIRGPFLVEASLYGLIGGVVAFSIAYSLLIQVLPGISGLQSRQTTIYFSENWLMVLGLTLVAGILIGLLSSSLATARYLKLKKW